MTPGPPPTALGPLVATRRRVGVAPAQHASSSWRPQAWTAIHKCPQEMVAPSHRAMTLVSQRLDVPCTALEPLQATAAGAGCTFLRHLPAVQSDKACIVWWTNQMAQWDGVHGAGGLSLQPDPIQPHGSLEQPVLPRAALYVPGNPSLLPGSPQNLPSKKSPRSTFLAESAQDEGGSVGAMVGADVAAGANLSELPVPETARLTAGIISTSTATKVTPEAAAASGHASRTLSIRDRIAALERRSSQSPEPRPKTPSARSGAADARQTRRSTSLPPDAGRGRPGVPAGRLASLPSCQGQPGSSLQQAERDSILADALCKIDLWAGKGQNLEGQVLALGTKPKDGEIGTETFPDCMYVGAFKGGMRDGLGAL